MKRNYITIITNKSYPHCLTIKALIPQRLTKAEYTLDEIHEIEKHFIKDEKEYSIETYIYNSRD